MHSGERLSLPQRPEGDAVKLLTFPVEDEDESFLLHRLYLLCVRGKGLDGLEECIILHSDNVNCPVEEIQQNRPAAFH